VIRFRTSAVAAGLTATLLAVLIGCRGGTPTRPVEPNEQPETPDGPAWFEDATDRLGLNFVHDPGDVDKFLMYQSIGSGCAIADLDGDGRPDLLLLTNAGPNSASTNKLFRQKPDGTFEDVSAGSGLDFSGWNMGVAIGDVNNDGRPDVLVTQANGVRLFLNLGGMKFADVTAEAGLANPAWGTAAAFLDYDRDGWLDIFVVNYVDYDPNWPCLAPSGERDYCAPAVFRGTASRLFRNRGGALEKGRRVAFDDVSASSRVGEKPAPGLGVAVADFDGDGWPDIFVANDGQPNHLWMNQHDGTFKEEALSRGAARTAAGHAYAGMGVALGDVDNDGLLDLYVTHLTGETNTLWKQGPPGQFRDRSTEWGLTATRRRATGFGTVMADFDNDGFLDIAVANGRVAREPVPRKKPGVAAHWEPYAERNQLFANTGGGAFRDVSHNNPALCGQFTVARGLACGDIDGDGAPDLLVNAIGEKARLLRNVAPNRGHWVSVRAFDPRLNRDTIGAAIAVRAGGVRRVRVIGAGDGFLSAGPLAAHFGLGSAAAIEGYEVAWPDGTRETFSGGPADRRVELRKGSGVKL
jgi:enediyne biosynthesis protein E4